LPPDKPTPRPAVTQHGKVAHVTHPLFTTYFNCAPVPMRQLAANLLARLLPEPLVKTAGLPSFARVTVTSQQQRRMIHALAYVPEHRGMSTEMIEEPIEVSDVQLSLRLDGRRPRRVYLAPDETALPYHVHYGYVHVKLPKIRGYALVVVEDK
jgi:hypothetical protein